MSDQFNDSLSALADGEASEFEMRRVLDALEQQSELGLKWQRYHLIRSAIRGERDTAFSDISKAVMAEVQKVTPEVAAPGVNARPVKAKMAEAESPARRNAGIWRSLISMATAASVTAAVILGVQGYQARNADSVADNAPQYMLPGTGNPENLVRAQYGPERPLNNLSVPQGDVIRLPRGGLAHYIDQHEYMLSDQKPGWKAAWLPDGFKSIRHEVLPQSEVMVYSDGRHAVSVCIEPFGQQSVAEGVAHANNIVAVGKRHGDHFVTVVGDVPLMIADRIAASVQARN